jgi:hypothetical protein
VRYQGVWADVSVADWDLELVPLEDDVLSLELEGGFKVPGFGAKILAKP